MGRKDVIPEFEVLGYRFEVFKDDAPGERFTIYVKVLSLNGELDQEDIREKFEHIGKWEQFIKYGQTLLKGLGLTQGEFESLPNLRLEINKIVNRNPQNTIADIFLSDDTGEIDTKIVAEAIKNIEKWLFMMDSKEIFKELLP